MKTKRLILCIALIGLTLLAILSIYGAFIGADSANTFFNSIPLLVYWCFGALIFVVGIIAFPGLRKKPGLFAIHIGCLLVLLGSLWATETGHKFAAKITGFPKIDEGYMPILEGQTENRVFDGTFSTQFGQLPFSIKLNDFRIEYYESDESQQPQLYIQTSDSTVYKLDATPNNKFEFATGTLTVLHTFDNFKLNIQDGKRIAIDQGNGKDNPAVEVQIELNDGTTYKRYAFEKFDGLDMSNSNDGLTLKYISQMTLMPKDYFSDLTILEEGKEVLNATIEVNHPLHYKGYHFYQDSYGHDNGQYTILAVTSDSGLYTVYAGYWLICIGVIWQMWIRHIIAYFKNNHKELPGGN